MVASLFLAVISVPKARSWRNLGRAGHWGWTPGRDFSLGTLWDYFPST